MGGYLRYVGVEEPEPGGLGGGRPEFKSGLPGRVGDAEVGVGIDGVILQRIVLGTGVGTVHERDA